MPILLDVFLVFGVVIVIIVLLMSGKSSPVPRRIEELERRVALLESALRERLPVMELKQEKLIETLPIDPILEEDIEDARRKWDTDFPDRRQP